MCNDRVVVEIRDSKRDRKGMVKYAVLVISVMLLAGSATSQSAEKVTVESPTEGRITHEFVGEQQMKAEYHG